MDIKGIKNDPYGKLASQSDSIARAQEATKDKTHATSKVTSQGDHVSVSSEGKLRIEAYKEAMKAADIREEKVAAIKAQIEAGTYEVNSKDIAKNILRSESELF